MFFRVRAAQRQPREEIQETLRKTQFVILPGPKDSRQMANGEAPESFGTRRGQDGGESPGQGLCGVAMGKARRGRVNCLGLASLNSIGGIKATGVSLAAGHLPWHEEDRRALPPGAPSAGPFGAFKCWVVQGGAISP